MNMQLVNTVSLCTYYICPLIYGDYSGLTDEECELIDSFIESAPALAIYDIDDSEPEFSRDEITSLMAECVTVKIYAPNAA